MSPEISVIIPAYNAARTVGIAVDSVLAQTFGDFELIVIDDGSPDNTAEVVRERSDPRVTCVTTENGGVSVARNRGVERASGSYVAFLDADDAWQPAKLERQIALLKERPDVGLCFTTTQFVDDDLQPTALQPSVQRADWTEALLLEGNILPGSASSVLIRAAVVEQCGGFDSRFSLCADWDMWLRMSVLGKIALIDEPLVLYRSVPGTMSSDMSVLERETFALLDKFYATPQSAPYERVRRRAYANRWMVCGASYLDAGQRRDAVRCILTGLRTDPRAARRLASLAGGMAHRARRRAQGLPARDPKILREET
jgi:glycosyltransferase involved in cell wall biosynthesis